MITLLRRGHAMLSRIAYVVRYQPPPARSGRHRQVDRDSDHRRPWWRGPFAPLIVTLGAGPWLTFAISALCTALLPAEAALAVGVTVALTVGAASMWLLHRTFQRLLHPERERSVGCRHGLMLCPACEPGNHALTEKIPPIST